jgi:hypothetical protein
VVEYHYRNAVLIVNPEGSYFGTIKADRSATSACREREIRGTLLPTDSDRVAAAARIVFDGRKRLGDGRDWPVTTSAAHFDVSTSSAARFEVVTVRRYVYRGGHDYDPTIDAAYMILQKLTACR